MKTIEKISTKGKGNKQTLQKINHGKHQITKLKEKNGMFITVQQRILEKSKEYYKKLYKVIPVKLHQRQTQKKTRFQSYQ